MRAVVQRVTEASVKVASECVGQIEIGLVVLLGVVNTTSSTHQLFATLHENI